MTPAFADVRAAADRLEGRIRRTPLLRHRALDEAAGCAVWVKPETLQVTGSFKLRGATNALLALRPDSVVTHSSGNHGQAVACAAAALGIPALVAMPADAPAVKVAATRAWGAEIHPFDRHGVDRDALAAELARGRGALVVPPFDMAEVIAGQGTAVLEALEEMDAPEHILVCTGGGGLLAGSALAAEAMAPGARLWAVEPEGWDDYGRSLRAGRRLANDGAGDGLCDALLSRMPGEITFAVNAPRVAGGVAVTRAEVLAAMRFAFTHLKLVVEPGGAVALAALLAGRVPVAGGRALVLLSGGNVDPATFAAALSAG